MFTPAKQSQIWLDPALFYTVAGSAVNRNVEYEGEESVGNPSLKAYLGRTDVSSDIFSGSPTARGNIVTLPELTGMQNNKNYVLSLTADVNGKTQTRQQEMRTLPPWQRYFESDQLGSNSLVWLDPPVVYLTVGSYMDREVEFLGEEIVASPSVKIYLSRSEVSLFSIGPTVQDNKVILPAVNGFAGGKEYVLALTVLVNGKTQVRLMELRTVSDSDRFALAGGG